MRKNLPLLVLLVLVLPVVLLAAVPLRQQQAAPTPAVSLPTVQDKSTFNDGWIDVEKVIPVPMMGGRGDHLDYFDSTLTLDDFEGSQPAWTSADITSGLFWMLWDTLTLGGTGLSWWCGDTCLAKSGTAGGYNNHWLQYLISDTLDLTSATACTLKFQAHWKCEVPGGEPAGYDMWDGWNVWVSTDAGGTWTVAQPTAPAYTGASSYAFGYEWGMGPGIPAYGDILNKDVFVECVFPLTGAQGHSDVLVRWAFCSDPQFCTLDDSSFYGVIIDSIRIKDGMATLLYNGGELDEFVISAAPPATDNWVYDNTTYYSATHSWWATMPTYNSNRSIVSFPITLPVGYDNLRIRYWVWCDMPDCPSSGFQDYYSILINNNDDCPSWEQVVYDYGATNGESPPGGNSLLGWVRRTKGLVSGSYTAIDISAYAGQTVRIAFNHQTDGDDDGGIGTGLHIDDVEVYAVRAYEHDLSCSEVIVPFPTTVGLTRPFGYRIVNEGLGNEGTVIRSQYWVFRPNGTQQITASPVMDSTTLVPTQDTVFTQYNVNAGTWVAWTPDVTGSYLLRARSNLITDLDRSNDTASTPTNVPLNPDLNLAVTVRPAGEYELGYHPRLKENAYLNPRYVRYTPAADGVPGGTVSAFEISKVRVMWQYDDVLADTGATTWIEFWEAGTDASPGKLINRVSTRIDTTETVGIQSIVRWWNLDLTGKIGLQNLSGNFWVSLTAKDSIGGGPLPLPMGKSSSPAAYDGHHFVIRLDSGSVFRPSPGRYLLETTIKPYTGVTPADPDTHTIFVFTIPDGPGPESKGLKLRWTPSVGALGYNIYQSTSIDPAIFQYIGTTTQTEAFMGVYMDSIPRMNYLIKATNHLPSGSSAFLGCGYTTGTDTIKSYPCDTLRFLVNWGTCSCDYIVLEYQGVGRGPLHCGNKSLYIWRDGAVETMQAWKVRTDVAPGYYTYSVTCRPSGATKTIVIHVDP